ncbi:ATP-binding cassette domain-containing protein [Georgenia sp. MJ173]|uniref:ATP-binding cassette domain-containing protein n=1 Tax=Georgenia sunbinii TaxID=3117728 RepID=UPI002F269BCC
MSTAYTATDPPAIEISDLRKAYGTTQVLDGISLTVPRGSVFALLGPNGAGKTTTINILSTLARPDAGRVTVAGHDVVRSPRAVHHAISLTGQFAAVDDLLTGRENLRMMAQLNHLPRRTVGGRVTELLEQLDIADAADRLVRTYSGGMRRRLDIAISLLARPQVLFLDEPTTGLDPRSRQGVWRQVRELTADGVTVVLTTQYLEEADSLADTIAVLHHGRIVAEGSAAELKRRVGADVVEVGYANGTREAIPTDGSVADLRRILADVDDDGRVVDRIGLREPSLDDVFLLLTRAPETREGVRP